MKSFSLFFIHPNKTINDKLTQNLGLLMVMYRSTCKRTWFSWLFFSPIKLFAFQVNLLPEMPSEGCLTNESVHSKTKLYSWMNEWTDWRVYKANSVFLPCFLILPFSKIGKFFATTSSSSIYCVHFLKKSSVSVPLSFAKILQKPRQWGKKLSVLLVTLNGTCVSIE